MEVAQIKRLTKEYFNQAEFRTLWYRMSQFADVESQLRSRLEVRESGIVLPRGDEQTYFRWVTQPKALILLQRTQEISKEDWNTLKQGACERFGEKEYLDLLRKHDESLPRIRAQEAPTFVKTNVLLAAIKEEEKGGREDWESKIPRTIELLRTNAVSELTELLHELKREAADRRKMSVVSRTQARNWQMDERRISQLMADGIYEE
jgi:hypothetical protein